MGKAFGCSILWSSIPSNSGEVFKRSETVAANIASTACLGDDPLGALGETSGDPSGPTGARHALYGIDCDNERNNVLLRRLAS